MPHPLKYLYIFLHIPKTGGDTIKYHIEKNFNSDERISLYWDFFTFSEADISPLDYQELANYYMLRKTSKDRLRSLFTQKIERHLTSLSEGQKQKLRILYGHVIPYGIDRFFDRPVRYITFLRHPLERAVSFYNYLLTQYHDYATAHTGMMASPRNVFDMSFADTVIHNNSVLSFREFFETRYDNTSILTSPFTATRTLIELGYFDDETDIGNLDAAAIMNALKKFYFIGITEKYVTDVAFLFYLLGIRTFYAKQNVSKKYFLLKKEDALHTTLLDKHVHEHMLYDAAVHHSAMFKTYHPSYYVAVLYVMCKKGIAFFFSRDATRFSLVYLLYKLSACLKKKLPWYGRLIAQVKTIVWKE